MAMLNANTSLKTILRALPIDPPPTIDQMIEACMKQASTENTMTQAVAQGIAQGVSGAFAVMASKDNARCFNCGKFGHFIAECPEQRPITNIRRDHQWLEKNSKKWWGRKNSQASTDRRRAMTAKTPLNQLAPEKPRPRKISSPMGQRFHLQESIQQLRRPDLHPDSGGNQARIGESSLNRTD